MMKLKIITDSSNRIHTNRIRIFKKKNCEYVYEFDKTPSEEDLKSAMDTIGGRPKRP